MKPPLNVAPHERSASLPRILVVGDFAQRSRPEPLAERVPCEVDLASFPRWLRSLGVWLEMGIPNVLDSNPPASFAIHLAPKATTKLTPDAIVAAIPDLANMQERILGLRGLRNFIACIKDFRQRMNAVLVQPNLREQLAVDIEILRTETSEPPSIVRELLTIAKLAPNDEHYASAAFAIRHMLGECFAKGATTIDAAVVTAEVDRLAALLASQVAIVFQQPSFRALERAWYGLEMLVRYESRARTNVVTCTENEFRDNAPVLLTWLRHAVREKTPYAAVLLAFDLDLNEWTNQCVMEQLAVTAADASIPILVGISAARDPISNTPFLVPFTSRTRVRPPYGDADSPLHARGFPFHEPFGGPPAANWVTGISVLARELGFGNA